MRPNVAASIRARLLNRARAEDTNFQFLLDRYACERFLYRLGQSDLRDRFILKGASLLAVWMDEPYRSTRDLDLLAFGASDEGEIRGVVESICGVQCFEDSLTFDVDSLRVSPIREGHLYEGRRVRLRAFLDRARATVLIDIAFGDAVTPERVTMPTLLEELPAPDLLAYPLVSVIAEKFEAMVQLGIRNSRMKDFYDIWALSETFDIDGSELVEAVERCFERRRTRWTADVPDALTVAFYANSERGRRWRAYSNQGNLLSPPPRSFEDIGLRIREFLGPVRERILYREDFEMKWPGGGPWRR